MSEIILTSNSITTRPLPQVNVTIRPGVLSDVPFLDSLQKLHTKQVGWMPTGRWLEEVNGGRYLPVVEGKYDVSRPRGVEPARVRETPLLAA